MSEAEIKARVDAIQTRNFELMQRGGVAIVALIDAIVAAKKEGATEAQLQPALELQRKAQWRLDFIAAENSMGFHAPQEAAMVLGEALDYARQGELAAARWRSPATAPRRRPLRAREKANRELPDFGGVAQREDPHRPRCRPQAGSRCDRERPPPRKRLIYYMSPHVDSVLCITLLNRAASARCRR